MLSIHPKNSTNPRKLKVGALGGMKYTNYFIELIELLDSPR
jgi:hypothetical protein